MVERPALGPDGRWFNPSHRRLFLSAVVLAGIFVAQMKIAFKLDARTSASAYLHENAFA